MTILRPIAGFFDELVDRFGDPRFIAELAKVEDPVDAELDRILEGLDSKDLEELRALVGNRRGLINTNAAYGNEINAISKQILTFGGAGIGLTAAFIQRLAELPPTILKIVGIASIFYANLVVLSLFIIFLFAWQARFRYPFLYLTKVGNTAPFFYYRAVSHSTPRGFFQTADQKLDAARLYVADLLAFVRHQLPEQVKIMENRPPLETVSDAFVSPASEARKRYLKRAAKDELLQYFLLIAYQGYVNQYEVKMNNIFLCGLIGSLSATSALALWVLFV